MNTAELLEKIKNTLSSDAALTSWCRQIFGQAPMVCIDIDENNPPDPETDYPLVAVTSIRQLRADSSRENAWELELGVGLVQEDIETGSGVRIMTGFVQVETMRELAEDALYRAHIGDASSQGESGSVSAYPLFISGTVMPIKLLKTNRRGLPG